MVTTDILLDRHRGRHGHILGTLIITRSGVYEARGNPDDRGEQRTARLAGDGAISLAPLVDQVVFVVESGRTSGRDVERALLLLPQEKILGLVLNRHKPTKKDAPYYPKYYPKK